MSRHVPLTEPIPYKQVTREAATALSFQRALLGAVSPRVRGVGFTDDGEWIRFVAYVEGPSEGEDIEALDEAATEVIADFNDRKIDFRCVRLDPPARLRERHGDLQRWVYIRFGD